MNCKTPCCGNNESNICGNVTDEDQMKPTVDENKKKLRVGPSLQNALIVILISIVVATAASPFSGVLPRIVKEFVNHQTSIIGYLYILKYRVSPRSLQIWKIGVWVWLLQAGIYSVLFYKEIGGKFTAKGIIWGGFQSELISIVVALFCIGFVNRTRWAIHGCKGKGWKFYFVFIVLLSIFGLIFDTKNIRAWDIVDSFILIPAIIGLFGYVWNKQIIRRQFWKIFFIAWLFWTLLYLFIIPIPPQHLKVEGVTLPQWLMGVLSLIPIFPHFIAIFRYAYRSSDKADESEM